VADLDAIEHELAEHGGLEDRPRLVVLNKADVPDAKELAEMVTPDLQARGYQVFTISAVTHEGLKPMLYAMSNIVAQARAASAVPVLQRITITPKAVNDQSFSVRKEGESFRVTGDKPERWVRQTDFSNSEAVGFLADRLAKLGVETALIKAGAERGAEVLIGSREDAVVFDFDPSVAAGAEVLLNRRGHDMRIEAFGYADRTKHRDRVRAEFDAYVAPWNIDDEDDEVLATPSVPVEYIMEDDDE
jgi:GTP-binding protein